MEDAVRTDAALLALETHKLGSIGVVVVGGGPSGVELAATVAERLGATGEVEVLTSGGDILEQNSAGQRDAARKALARNNCAVLTGCRVSAIRKDEAAPRPYTVVMQDGRESSADLVLWTAGQTPVVPQSSRDAVDAYGIQLAARGEAMTDAFLRVRSQRQMFALGDAAFVEDSAGNKLPATAQVTRSHSSCKRTQGSSSPGRSSF
jgi:NADH:ubiquinone reductase (non-electrogenic)